jgi:hypothetical protein
LTIEPEDDLVEDVGSPAKELISASDDEEVIVSEDEDMDEYFRSLENKS